MKKIFATTLALSLMFATFGQTLMADEVTETAEVYVTISDQNGDLVLTQEKVTVTDQNADGKLTIDEALYAAHEENYTGGAAAGYASSMTSYGLSLDKLWGVANGGSYGYRVNHESAWSLADTVSTGDYIQAYVYTDLTTWSDTYSYFTNNTITAMQNSEITVTLMAAAYDADWNPISVPVEGATITINGVETQAKTDATGKANITLSDAGTCVISATSESQTLVPPVCVATVKAPANVYVTIADAQGNLALVQEKVTVTDVDKDGLLTMSDALYAAHEAKFEGGATAGYASSMTSYGMSLDKLWGVANGGSYGYYLNHESPLSLLDEVEEGDFVNAYVYTDLEAWSDTYCFFNVNTIQEEQGKTVSLTLNAYAYDANWNQIVVPVEGATITINGTETTYKTDADGKVNMTLSDVGTCVISAVSDTQTLVPPACVATVTSDDTNQNGQNNGSDNQGGANSPDTADEPYMFFFMGLLAIGCATVILSRKGKTTYEK